mmetsp:Transcript_41526/g.124095  ORF Transcript_41526/g.124095 Transcript_41526/m.124095 type:complete len:231 (-) Transcript_41526:878-1570(-)
MDAPEFDIFLKTPFFHLRRAEPRLELQSAAPHELVDPGSACSAPGGVRCSAWRATTTPSYRTSSGVRADGDAAAGQSTAAGFCCTAALTSGGMNVNWMPPAAACREHLTCLHCMAHMTPLIGMADNRTMLSGSHSPSHQGWHVATICHYVATMLPRSAGRMLAHELAAQVQSCAYYSAGQGSCAGVRTRAASCGWRQPHACFTFSSADLALFHRLLQFTQAYSGLTSVWL